MLMGLRKSPDFIYGSKKNVFEELSNFANVHHVDITRRITILTDIKTIFKLIRVFRKEQFYCIHSVTSKVGILVMISGYLSKVKNRFHTFTGQVWANKTGLPRIFFKKMDQIIAYLATKTFADSPSQKEFLVSEGVVNKDKIKVLGPGSISGVDLERFSQNPAFREKIRHKYNIKKDTVVFLLLCRLTRDKGTLDLAHAFSRVVQELDCCLLIVGPDEENLTSTVMEIVGKKNEAKVYFHGYTDCHEEFLNAADILFLPSYREGFGSIIIDAAGVGIPTIGSDIYGISDAIDNGRTGILHKAGDIDEIYKSMLKLATNSNLRKSMGDAAKIRAHENYSMEKITKAWVDEYNFTLG